MIIKKKETICFSEYELQCIDMTIRLAVALAKVTIGRIRSRYTQTNAIWGNDGERMLDEGNTELTALRDLLASNDNLTQPID